MGGTSYAADSGDIDTVTGEGRDEGGSSNSELSGETGVLGDLGADSRRVGRRAVPVEIERDEDLSRDPSKFVGLLNNYWDRRTFMPLLAADWYA